MLSGGCPVSVGPISVAVRLTLARRKRMGQRQKIMQALQDCVTAVWSPCLKNFTVYKKFYESVYESWANGLRLSLLFISAAMNNCGRFSRSIGSIYFVELLTELFDFTVGHIKFVWVFIQFFWSFGQFTMKLVNWFSLYAPSFGQVRGHSLVGRWWTTIGSPFWSNRVSEQ